MRTIYIRPETVRLSDKAAEWNSDDYRLHALPPLALYVHVPWCVRKCPYCDFNSHAAPAQLPENEYLAALEADLQQALPLVWGRRVISIFIGGGTPSLLSEAALDRLLSMVRTHLNVLPDAEITLEANPGTVEAARFKSYARSGINRISLGIQSFDERFLQRLGRIHDGTQARAAVDMAQLAVERVNLDLMFALPGQGLDELGRDLDAALSFGCEHLSVYHLTLEPATVFAKYPPSELPDDDLAADMQDLVEDMLQAAGYDHYEVSAYARSGARCVHNLNYWQFGDYLGIGPGAHGKLSFHDHVRRQARLRNPESWMRQVIQRDGSHLAEDRRLTAHDLPFEFMLNALRLREGVPAWYFQERTGLPLALILPQLEQARSRGLLTDDPARIAPSPLGWRFLNDLQAMFLQDDAT